MAKHIPNPETYRAYLGKSVNSALFRIVEKKNADGLTELSVTDYLEKMILHWYRKEFPNAPIPYKTKGYLEDFDFVQSA